VGAGPEGGEAIAWQWREQSIARFLAAYAETVAGGAAAVDDDLLRLFILQKALYEIGYEAANRPTWVATPVRGVLALLDRGGV
jgi:maltose alpha-D-glucosyltransferase/alpha-amylase